MVSKTSGIVLRNVKYSSSSVIATIYTQNYGIMPFMVRGVGRKSSRAACLQLLSRVELTCTYREKRDVQSLSSIALHPEGAFIHFHPGKAAIRMFLAEMLYKTLREASADPDMYEFIDSAFAYFSEAEFNPNFHLLFLVQLTGLFGFYPSGKWSEKHPYFDLIEGMYVMDQNKTLHTLEIGVSKNLSQIIDVPLSSTSVTLNNQQRRELLHMLVNFIQIHLPGTGDIKSLDILQSVFL